jgi:predicted acetyltransferase
MPKDQDFVVGPPTDDAEIKAFAACVSQALFSPDIDLDAWVEREGPDNIRVARSDHGVAGGLIRQPMGQWFGGRSVSMGAIRAVGVAPQFRGARVGSQLMRAILEESHRDGIHLSTLYAATQPIYRRCGFERAGVRLMYGLPAQSIDLCDRTLTVRPIEPSDYEKIYEAYTARAASTAGNLDRTWWMWQRIFDPLPPGRRTYGYLVEQDGRVDAYAVYTQKGGDPTSHANELALADLVVLTPEAGRRLLTFLADHRSMVGTITWCGAPAEPMLYLLAEYTCKVVDRMDWMLRIVDVRGALEARGYPPALAGELHLDIRDDIIADNNRRFVLEVAESRGHVREGGRGDVRVDIRALAVLYAGHLSPMELKVIGYIDGPGEQVAATARFFAGPSPWMPDVF